MTTLTKTVPQALITLVADHTLLYQKLRSYHWTVTGPQFFALHEKFEVEYQRVADAIDDLAERAVALGERPLGTLAGCIERSGLEEDAGSPDARAMVEALLEDFRQMATRMRKLIELAEGASDRTTVNLCEDIVAAHDQTTWMLRAFLSA